MNKETIISISKDTAGDSVKYQLEAIEHRQSMVLQDPSQVPYALLQLRKTPPFKNPSWEGKPLPRKDPKNYFNSLKQSGEAEGADCLQILEYLSLDAGPSVRSEEKYCDLTGFHAYYEDKTTHLRYYNGNCYKMIRSLNPPSIQALLDLRKGSNQKYAS